MRACVLLGLLAGCAGQASEWTQSDAAIAALCNVAEGAAAQGAAPAALESSNIAQASGTKVTVSAPGTPDAVWLKDSYGVTVAYVASPTLPATLDFGTDAETLQLYAHYPSCHITASGFVDTWKKQYNDYVSSDSDSFSGSLSADQIQSTLPAFTNVNLGANPPTATISFTQAGGGQGVGIPHVYVSDDHGTVLAYTTTYAAAPGGTQTRTITFEVPASSTTLTACTLACASHELAADIVDSIEASGYSASAFDVCAGPDCSLPTTFADETLTVRDNCAADYSLYAVEGGAILSFGINQALSVNVAGKDSVLVKQLCNGALASMTVSVAPLRQAYADAIAAAPTSGDGSQVGALTCNVDGVTRTFNEVWSGPHGSKCICIQGVAECGGGLKRGIYFDNAGVLGVTLSAVVIAGAIGGTAYYAYMQKKAREVVEGRRRSVSGQTYYGNALPSKGQQEIELPEGGRNVGVETSNV